MLNYRVLALPETAKTNIQVLLQELNQTSLDTRYDQNNQRWIKEYEEIADIEPHTLPFKQGGVYMITGGMGGLGLIFAVI